MIALRDNSPTMTDTPAAHLAQIYRAQREFFATHATRPVAFRIEQLKRLREAMKKHERRLLDALHADLHKGETEAYFSEIGITQSECSHALAHVGRWAKPQRIRPALVQLPSSCWVYPEPLGTTLIIAPWNYSVQLVLAPLVGALAAGNTAVLKPSEFTPHVSAVLAELVRESFDPRVVALVEGDATVSQQLAALSWDLIFFTGSTRVGTAIAQSAAANLTPTVLELGGKSPCIVDADVNVEITANRIAWGKWVNCGQTCVAPDYVLVDKKIKQALLGDLTKAVRRFYGDDAQQSKDYGRMVNAQHFARVQSYLQQGRVVHGGQVDEAERFIAPTLMTDVDPNSPLMQDEIFGPLLPVIEYETLDEAIRFVNARPKPLSLYVFSNNKQVQDRVLSETHSGNAGVNEVTAQFGSPFMPFGGVGASGMGSYHGRASFDAFSQRRSVLKKSLGLDPWFRWLPYSKVADRMFRWLLK